ncbi:MAG TPA: GAF domain-containing SpoIIE family protein phosphatase [Acidimicrobiales bacterium]|nr:GAF domain-containing SpoIIE family protein phosphatase [Acidimicrobiales bacterium]
MTRSGGAPSASPERAADGSIAAQPAEPDEPTTAGDPDEPSEAEERLQATEERLQAISRITDSSLGHLDVDDLFAAVLQRVVEVLDADTAAVLLVDESARQLVARAAYGLEEEVRQGVRVAIGRGFAGRVAAERRPIAIERVDETTVENPLLWQRGLKALLGVPLQSGGRLLGVMHVGSLTERRFSDQDAELLGLAADRIAAAVLTRELGVERSAARVLQRSLLPTALPACPGIEFATRYVPAEEGGVGGDWYDAFVVPSGDLWVMAGDVVGHGLMPAVVMGRLRSTLRSYALEGHDPEDVLALGSRKLAMFEPGFLATVVCARLEAPYDSMRIASVGHPPPVLAAPGEAPRLLEIPVSAPLGVVDERPLSVKFDLPLGAVFVAYTDGLVERRGASLDVGLQRLLGAVEVAHPEAVCRQIMGALIGNEIARDDIAVIALRRVGTRSC